MFGSGFLFSSRLVLSSSQLLLLLLFVFYGFYVNLCYCFVAMTMASYPFVRSYLSCHMPFTNFHWNFYCPPRLISYILHLASILWDASSSSSNSSFGSINLAIYLAFFLITLKSLSIIYVSKAISWQMNECLDGSLNGREYYSRHFEWPNINRPPLYLSISQFKLNAKLEIYISI